LNAVFLQSTPRHRRSFLHLGATPAVLAVLLALLCACTSPGGRDIGSIYGQNRTGAQYLAAIRSSQGLGPLQADATLEAAALDQARRMARSGRMAHTTGAGASFPVRMARGGVEGAAAENIAYGGFGPAELFQRWMDSPGHRRNMLNPSYTRYGLASAQDSPGSGRRYWALVLAR